MYIGASKPHTTLVVEHTFLLCKPDAEQHHRYILQTVSDAGFQVLAKSFIITPALAEELANTFQSVRRRRHAERGVDKIFSEHKTSSSSQNNDNNNNNNNNISPQKKRKDIMNSSPVVGGTFTADEETYNNNNNTSEASSESIGGGNDVDNNTNNTNTNNTGMLKHHRGQDDTHQGIIAEILRLTSRHTDGEGVNAGLPNVSDVHRVATASAAAADGQETSDSDGRNNDSRIQTEQKPERRLAAGIALKNTMIEAMSYKELLTENVRHLAFGGTCLAVELSRHNAVEKLLEIVGPENPIDARRAAPYSLRARIGTDLVRNAVYAATNLAEASHCISAVFGFATRYSTADIKAHTAMPEAGGVKNDETVSGNYAVVRPYCKLVSVVNHSSSRAPVTAAAVLRIDKTNPQAHVSYYTGQPLPGQTRENGENDVNIRHGHNNNNNTADSESWKQKAEQLSQQLQQEQMDLMLRAKLLRARELDLLLREHALEKATRNVVAPAGPLFEGKMESHPFARLPSMSIEEQLGRPRMSPPPLIHGQQPLMPPRNLSGNSSRQSMLEPRLTLTRNHTGMEAMTIATGRGMPPTIEAEDVSLLLSKPVRLRALYVALRHHSESGELTRDELIALYDRSPTVQLLWMDDHRERFQKYVQMHTEEPVSFDSFVSVLMFLFKQ